MQSFIKLKKPRNFLTFLYIKLLEILLIPVIMKQSEFEIRTYGFGELAQLYFPKCTKSSASRVFRNWINGNPGLVASLREAGWKKRQKYFTPKQVKKLVEHFDIP